MIQPANLPILAHRWVPLVYTVAFSGIDLTGATFAAQVRLNRDAPGSPLVSLANASSPSQGISVSVDATGTMPVSTIEMRIDKTAMEALPAGAEAGDDAQFFWDMHITPSGGIEAVYFEGVFTVRGGATQ